MCPQSANEISVLPQHMAGDFWPWTVIFEVRLYPSKRVTFYVDRAEKTRVIFYSANPTFTLPREEKLAV